MERVMERAMQEAVRGGAEYYFWLFYTAGLVLGTILWAERVFMELTRQHKPKLLERYGSGMKKEKRSPVLVIVMSGVVLAAAWTIFILFI